MADSYWLEDPVELLPRPARRGRADVIIIGGGVTGCSCALTLAEAGMRVRLHVPTCGSAVGWSRSTSSTPTTWSSRNGSRQGLLPALDAAVTPRRGQVLATEPLGQLFYGRPHYARHGFD